MFLGNNVLIWSSPVPDRAFYMTSRPPYCYSKAMRGVFFLNEPFSYVKTLFCSNKFTLLLAS